MEMMKNYLPTCAGVLLSLSAVTYPIVGFGRGDWHPPENHRGGEGCLGRDEAYGGLCVLVVRILFRRALE